MSRIEPATGFHAPALALIHAAAFPPAERWSHDAIALQLAQPGAFGFVTPAGGFALARATAGESELLTLAVHPSARRTGLARALTAHILTEAASRGAVAMFLEVSERNDPARALYAALGFVPVGRRPKYYSGGVDALVLRAATPCGSTTG